MNYVPADYQATKATSSTYQLKILKKLSPLGESLEQASISNSDH